MPAPFLRGGVYTLEEFAIARRPAAVFSICLVLRPDVMAERAPGPAAEVDLMVRELLWISST